MIELKNVSKFYSNNGISNVGIQNINLKLSVGEIVAITGESGSGKSTLLNVIAKIDNFDEGEIYYKGNETSYFTVNDMDDFRKNKVGFIFQNYNILDSYTVLDNVMLPLILKGVAKDVARDQALKLIEKVGLKGKEENHGTKLSGGEKQRCVIARALASDCEILACDEPTGNLDSVTAKQIIDLICEIAKDKLVLIVTHNFPEVEDKCTRQLVVADGRIVEDRVNKEIIDNADEKLDLDYKPIPRKLCYGIGLNNIKFTPKKTILVFLIFFFISLFFIFITQACINGIAGSQIYSNYGNQFDNYMMVYHSNHDTVDTTLLEKYDYKVNNFITQQEVSCLIGSTYYYVQYEDNIPGTKIVEGRDATSDNEFVLYLSSNDTYAIREAKESIGTKIQINGAYGYTYESDYVLVGIGTFPNTTTMSYCYFIGGNDKLETLLNNSLIAYSISIIYESDTENGVADIDYTNSSKTCIHVPTSLQPGFSYNAKILNTYDTLAFDVVYDDTYPTVTLCYNLNQEVGFEPFMASIYFRETNYKAVKKNLKSLGFDCVYPAKESTDEISQLLGKLLGFLIAAELACYLIGIFFITYVVLKKVYQSRIKDYEILRILGVTKTEMKRVVNFELLSLGLLATVFSFILCTVLIYSIKAFAFMRGYDLITLIFYFGVMYLFVSLMAKKFNKSLFKFTIRKSLEGGEEE